jgi:hypothetical protein
MKLLPGLLFKFILLCIASSLYSQSVHDWQGIWIRIHPDTVLLEIFSPAADSFEFIMISFHPNFAGHIGRDGFSSPKYAHIRGKRAHFNDTGAISDGRPLYYKGEKPCKLVFTLKGNSQLSVKETNCLLIYGGAGVTWEGDYSLIKQRYFFNDLLCNKK